MIRLPVAAALAALIALPAAAQPAGGPADAGGVILAGEEAVTFRLDAGGATVTGHARAQWEPVDVSMARELIAASEAQNPAAMGPNALLIEQDGAPPPIAPEQIRAKMMAIAGRQSMLVIENGYRQALFYRARITRAGRTEPTDVCLVLPDQRGYEHWPYVIERIELSGFRLVDWSAGDPVPCV